MRYLLALIAYGAPVKGNKGDVGMVKVFLKK